MTRQQLRNAAFLGVGAAWVGYELWQALDGDPETRPLTDYLTDLPGPVLALLVGAFSVWLPTHLWLAYREKHDKE